MTSFEIESATAFVTGANRKRGIGRAIVRALGEKGARRVYATARRKETLQDLVSEFPDVVVPVALDVTDAAAVEKLGEQYPDVNLVVNNAGVFGRVGSLDELSTIENEMEVNYLAPLRIVQSFRKQLNRPARGEIKQSALLNINSIASLVNFPFGGTYSASKAASHSLTQAQRRDLPEALVIGVYPGPIETDMTDGLPFDRTSPQKVAEAVVRALETGTEDVFPDPAAAQMFEGWKQDAKAMERQMAAPMKTAG